jgi:hypothetical protein
MKKKGSQQMGKHVKSFVAEVKQSPFCYGDACIFAGIDYAVPSDVRTGACI